MKYAIYSIKGYVDERDDLIIIWVQKFISFRINDEIHYKWLSIEDSEDSGLHIYPDYISTDRDGVLLKIFDYQPGEFVILRGSFDEMIEAYSKMKTELESKLKYINAAREREQNS